MRSFCAEKLWWRNGRRSHLSPASIARDRRKTACVTLLTFDRWCQETRGSERGGADSRLADDPDAEPALRRGGSAGEADEPTPNDENIGG